MLITLTKLRFTMRSRFDICFFSGSLEKSGSDKIRQMSSGPKFQVYNHALISTVERRKFQNVSADHVAGGRWVESAFGIHMLHQAGMHDP